jgi:hypothetical protein
VVAGVNDVFRTVSNGTFTRGTILSVFAAPSFTFLVLQGVMDTCLFVPPFIVVITIFGKWVLGHFATGTSKGNDVQMRRRPLHEWPQHVRARVLSWLNTLPVWFGFSQALYTLCWLFVNLLGAASPVCRSEFAKLSLERRLSPELHQKLSKESV